MDTPESSFSVLAWEDEDLWIQKWPQSSVLVSFSTEVIIKNFTKSSKITGETVQWLKEVTQIFICLFYLIRSRKEGNGNPLQYSCLENSLDRGAWQATIHGVAKSWT